MVVPKSGGSTKAQQEQIGKLIAALGWNSAGASGWLRKYYSVGTRAELSERAARLATAHLVNRIDVSGQAPAEVQPLLDEVSAWSDFSALVEEVEARVAVADAEEGVPL